MVRRHKIGIAATAALLLTVATAQAGGLGLYEIATPDMGRAAAGRAAVAEDASTAFGNPAGMAKLDRPQWLIGLQPLILTSKFKPGDGTDVSGSDGGNAGGVTPAASLSYVHPLGEDYRLGVFVGSYFGLAVDPKDDWVGRYYVQESALLTLAVNPVISYRVDDWLSVGGGVSMVAGVLDQKIAINNPGPNQPDGRLRLEDTVVGFGFNAGLLIDVSPGTRIGLTYRSAVDLDFEDAANADGLGPVLEAALGAEGLLGARLDLGLTVPQEVLLSLKGTLTDEWTLLANIGWQDWSDFGKTEVVVASEDTTSLTADREFDDTYHAALGVQYQVDPAWLLTAGFAYDTAAVEARKRTIDLPVDRQLRYAVGAQYDWTEDLTLGLAYTFVDLGSGKVDQERGQLAGRVQGKYSTNMINVVNLNLIWRL